MTSRREFLAAFPISLGVLEAIARAASPSDALRRWLEPYVVRRSTIDLFLDPTARIWAKYEPEFGYSLRNAFIRDGVDGCHTLARYADTGQRLQVNFADQPCRINTYGDSFTQGHQVSDGETWQEILAAHFCEPVRNFGVGGFGVYQAYRRLLKIEAGELRADHLIFNIWGDDHLRSIYAWRWLAFPKDVIESMSGLMFHANPWVHARLDAKRNLVDVPNLCPTAESLYQLCDLDFLVDSFQNDEIAHLQFAQRTGIVLDMDMIESVAVKCDFKELKTHETLAIQKTAQALIHKYAIQVGMAIIDRMWEYCQTNSKRLMVVLSYPIGSVWHACNRSPATDPDNTDWHPKEFKDHLRSKGIPLFDSLEAHVAEFDSYKLSAKEYVDRYYIGHYTPRGNHFFAYAMKDRLLEWLDPTAVSYRNDQEPLIRFKGYLPG